MYHANNAVQSVRVDALVSAAKSAAITGVVDYTLARDVARAVAFAPGT